MWKESSPAVAIKNLGCHPRWGHAALEGVTLVKFRRASSLENPVMRSPGTLNSKFMLVPLPRPIVTEQD
jgi:hypothetical protein